ncbi:MAG: ATP-dependent metallopeptidase FtsH/Yme1/Tma family protein [Candidatus Cloacimonetes bacterium]|nr:ATP-dependent metallopeptidase FtsH/Yme1/Tma family protein [Candidatus Cloacimonadota bacterium]
MKKSHSITFWIVLLLITVIMFQFSKNTAKATEKTYSEFKQLVTSGQVLHVNFDGKNIGFTTIENKKLTSRLPFEDPQLVTELEKANIAVSAHKPSKWFGFFINFLPFIIFIGIWVFLMRGMRGGGGSAAFSFGKNKAKLSISGKTKITFTDVAGVDEAKEELEEIVEFLKNPKKFQKLGGRIPRGVLLLGRPGTGKTLLAKAVAGEAKVPFYSISGSDFVEMFVGVGASRVRNMFADAKKNAPCIAFIDEIDAVGRHRGSGLGGGHDEREQTLNQLLVEMDGFDPNDSVIIIAATNRPDVLDPALLRPGRFDRQIMVDLPDIKGREEILKVHTRKLPISAGVVLNIIARVTPGFSGADLANLVNEAALLAARKGKKKIEMNDFEEAKDKVTLGKARKSRVITEEDKKITAVHEIGHVICSMFLEKVEPIHKVTIIPRGFTAGATHFLQTDKTHYLKSYMTESLVGLLGGRAAEEVIFNDVSTGASNDIERATDLAKQMVCNWGMSEKIGPIKLAQKQSQMFLGRDISQHDNISEETAKIIDSEVKNIISKAHETAENILTSKRELLEKLADVLLEKETIEAKEIFTISIPFIAENEKPIVDKKMQKIKDLDNDIKKAERRAKAAVRRKKQAAAKKRAKAKEAEKNETA